MSDVTRYAMITVDDTDSIPYGNMIEHEQGGYVLFEDYETLSLEHARFTVALAGLIEAIRDVTIDKTDWDTSVGRRLSRAYRCFGGLHPMAIAQIAAIDDKHDAGKTVQHSASRGETVKRLTEALRVYGGHIPQCEGRPCTCGFQAEWIAAGLPS